MERSIHFRDHIPWPHPAVEQSSISFLKSALNFSYWKLQTHLFTQYSITKGNLILEYQAPWDYTSDNWSERAFQYSKRVCLFRILELEHLISLVQLHYSENTKNSSGILKLLVPSFRISSPGLLNSLTDVAISVTSVWGSKDELNLWQTRWEQQPFPTLAFHSAAKCLAEPKGSKTLGVFLSKSICLS